MNDIDYYSASVPVFLHYLDRMAALLARADVTPEVLSHRLAPDMAPASAQFSTAINFSLRTCLKLAGTRVSGVPQVDASREVLADWLQLARAKLVAIKPEDMVDRTIQHRAAKEEAKHKLFFESEYDERVLQDN